MKAVAYFSHWVRRNLGLWTVAILWLNAAACFRTLDAAKLKCNSRATCPTGFVCSMDNNQTFGSCVLLRTDGGTDVAESSGQGGKGGSGGMSSADDVGGNKRDGAGGAPSDAPGTTGASDAPLALALGASCAADNQCSSAHCVDGICCDKTCGGCKACTNALTGKEDGVCDSVASGQDPHDFCADETASKRCGNDGTCDGNGTCRKVGTSHVCAAGSCSSDGKVFTPTTTCDGKGECTIAAPQSCGEYQCANTGCAIVCDPLSPDDKCVKGTYCNAATKTCAAQKPNGQPASQATECTSGIVADGVCCDKLCTGCSACASGLNGQADGTTGQCLPVKAGGDDPHKTCTASPPCGLDGKCDGAGACRSTAAGTSCAADACTGSTLTKSVCDSSHLCTSSAAGCPNSTVCASTSACKTGCTVDADCATGSYCASGACKPKGTGTCSSGTECSTGNCVDGHCCDSKCDGNCESCATGTCSFTATPRKACGGTGKCAGVCDKSNRQACTFDSTIVCAAQSCAGGVRTDKALCDDKGSCQVQTKTNCDSNLCAADGSDCAGSCAGMSCGTGKYCAGTTCATLKAKGDSCSDKTECSTGNCVDGYCCDSACNGTCQSCSVTHGTCTNTTSPHSGKSCSGTGTCASTCNGSSPECVFPVNAACGSASCLNSSTLQLAGTCNSQGSCSQSTQSCTCVQNACADCSPTASQCSAGVPQTCNASGHWTSGSCGTGKVCSGTATNCVCSSGTDCGTSGCINVNGSDSNHCGSCTNVCPTGKACSSGSCVCSGSTPKDCSGTCYASSACCSSSDCGAGKTCTNHQCYCDGSNGSCGSGTSCTSCNGTSNPYCLSGSCVQCKVDSDCATGGYFGCNSTTHKCICRTPNSGNKVANPGFDGSLASWNATGATYAIADADVCPGSGSASLGTFSSAISQCVNIGPNVSYNAGFLYKGTVYCTRLYYTMTNCNPADTNVSDPFVYSAEPGATSWTPVAYIGARTGSDTASMKITCDGSLGGSGYGYGSIDQVFVNTAGGDLTF